MSLFKYKSYKWIVLVLLFVEYFVLQSTRQLYYASIPPIREDLGLGSRSLGVVATVFLAVYGMVAPCASIVADLLHRKTIVVTGCLVFSVGIFASGFSMSIMGLIVGYGIVVALGQSMVPASSNAIVAAFHKKTRSTALSIYQSALYLGVIFASVFAGRIGTVGVGAWRWGFWCVGVIGIIWCVVLVLFLRERTAAMKTRVLSKDQKSAKAAILSVIGSPAALFLTLGFGFCQYGDNGFRVWMATYLGDTFLPQARTVAAFHSVFWFYLGAFLGINVMGWLTDRLVATRSSARFEIAALGLALSAPCAFMSVRTGSISWACVGLFCWGLARGAYDSNFLASLYEVVETRYQATATGLFCCGGFLVGAAAPTILGWIAEKSSLMVGMSSLGIFYLLGAFCVILALRQRT